MRPEQIERWLVERPLPEILPPDEGWVVPAYEGLSIANLPATIAALLDSELDGALPPLPEQIWRDWAPGLRRVVLVILDALGYRMLHDSLAAGGGQPFRQLAQAGTMVPLTSIFPSTTAAALVSLRTGRPPAEHGWLAYYMYLRELGVAANAITLSPIRGRGGDILLDWGLDPESLVSVPSLAECLARSGIATRAVLSVHFRNSGFTKMLYRGVAEIRGHLHASDLWGQLRHLLSHTRGQRAMLTAYWGGLDALAHAYGPQSDLWQAEFRTVSHLLKEEVLDRLPAQDRDGTLLLLTADHGQIEIPPERTVIATEHPELLQHLLVPVVGEPRAAFLYPRPGRAGAIADYLGQAFPGSFAILHSAEALEAGLMGRPVSDKALARAGELLVLPRANYAIQQDRPKEPSVGRHGGLSAQEMLVPFIGTRLEALS
jgi:predicted AlkP superfamily pyrophosphatase or phosphodiesterase